MRLTRGHFRLLPPRNVVPAGQGLLQDLAERRQRRIDAGQDPYGKLHLASKIKGKGTQLLRIDAEGLDPGWNQFNKQQKNEQSMHRIPNYKNWRLRHTHFREVVMWSAKEAWKATTCRTRSNSVSRQWQQFVDHCKSTTIYQWYEASARSEPQDRRSGLRECPGPGTTVDLFAKLIRSELQWFPSARISSVWDTIGFSSKWDTLTVEIRNTYIRTWTELQVVGQWCRRNVDNIETRLAKEYMNTTVAVDAKAFVVDVRQVTSSSHQQAFQTKLVSSVQHMYDR